MDINLNALDLDDAEMDVVKPKFNKSYNSLLDDSILENYDHICTPPGSPYSRRRPVAEKREKREFVNKTEDIINWAAHDTIEEAHYENDVDDIVEPDPHIVDHHLPIVMERRVSVRSLKNRHNTHYQGMRFRRPVRVLNKSGERNITVLNLPEKSVRFFKDMVTTLVEEQWRYTLLAFALSFFCSWIVFAILWYIVALAHGDLNFDEVTGKRMGDGSMPCVRGATTFAGFLLLSIETQVSTGYGEKYPTEECPEAIFLMIIQLIVGMVIDGAMIGIVYAKMSRPPRKSGELKFSKKAVICQRDGKLCFIFRVSDIKQNHSICTNLQAVLIKDKRSLEGECLGKTQWHLKLENNGNAIILWPTTICHVIDKASPLYDLSAKDLLDKKFEIIVTLTGNSRTTGQTTQVRSSYLPREIYWGHRFVNLIDYDILNNCYVAHNEYFDTLEQVDTALCSAKRLDQVMSEVQSYFEENPDFYIKKDNESSSISEDIPEKSLPEEVAGPSRKFIVTQVKEDEQTQEL